MVSFLDSIHLVCNVLASNPCLDDFCGSFSHSPLPERVSLLAFDEVYKYHLFLQLAFKVLICFYHVEAFLCTSDFHSYLLLGMKGQNLGILEIVEGTLGRLET